MAGYVKKIENIFLRERETSNRERERARVCVYLKYKLEIIYTNRAKISISFKKKEPKFL